MAAAWPALFAGISGPRVAVFHDAIGLKLPELTPPGTVRRLPGYLRELLQFDGIAANSADSAASLRDYFVRLMTPVRVEGLSKGELDGPAYKEVVRQLGAGGWLGLSWP